MLLDVSTVSIEKEVSGGAVVIDIRSTDRPEKLVLDIKDIKQRLVSDAEVCSDM